MKFIANSHNKMNLSPLRVRANQLMLKTNKKEKRKYIETTDMMSIDMKSQGMDSIKNIQSLVYNLYLFSIT